MPLPVRSLPTYQNWECRSCGECCRNYAVRVTDEERARIEGQGWEGFAPTVFDKPTGDHRLNHKADGSCVFLGDDARCAIHAKFGAAAKPMACRIYPFVLVPAGDHWRVGMRFACPSVTANVGPTVPDQLADVATYARFLEADAGEAALKAEPPPLRAGQLAPWGDIQRFRAAVGEVLAADAVPLERRLRQVFAIAGLCRKAVFDKVSGHRLAEFLEVVKAVAIDETPDIAAASKPTWIGRVVFRQITAIYGRKDNGSDKGDASKSRWVRFRAGWRYARGTGRIPKLHAKVPDGATFADAERPAGPLPPESERLLSRYFRVKVESMQFCGPSLYGLPFWEGLDTLLITFAATLFHARVFAAKGGDRAAAIDLALRAVDDSFGFNTMLAAPRQRWATRTLSERGDIPRLIAWYSQ